MAKNIQPKIATPEEVASAIAQSVNPSQSPRKGKFIFWLGAGASATAGIPLADGMVDRVLDRLWRDQLGSPSSTLLKPYPRLSREDQDVRQTEVRRWALQTSKVSAAPIESDWGHLYSQCLGLLHGGAGKQEFVVECIKEGRGRLNFAHLYLAQLMTSGFARIVLTTNFDDLLLRALQLYDEFPAVLDPDSTRELSVESRFLQVAYLHGKLTSYSQRHTKEDVRGTIPEFEPFLQQALNTHGLVVVGYRGGDETPMRVLAKVLRSRGRGPGRGLYWVTPDDSVDALSGQVRLLLQLKDVYLVQAWADDFFETLCSSPQIGLSLPDFLTDPRKLAMKLAKILPAKLRGRLAVSLGEIGIGYPPVDELEGQRTRPIDSARLVRRAAILLELHKYAEAILLLKEAILKDHWNDEAHLRLGNALVSAGQPAEALEYFEHAAHLAPIDPQPLISWGMALDSLGRYDEAIGKFRRTTELHPEHAVAFYNWGLVLQHLNHYQEAIDKYRLATTLRPTLTAAFINWGVALMALGRPGEALGVYERGSKIEPPDPAVYWNWGLALQQLGLHEEAEEKFARHKQLAKDQT